jgi:hypothetical protein
VLGHALGGPATPQGDYGNAGSVSGGPIRVGLSSISCICRGLGSSAMRVFEDRRAIFFERGACLAWCPSRLTKRPPDWQARPNSQVTCTGSRRSKVTGNALRADLSWHSFSLHLYWGTRLSWIKTPGGLLPLPTPHGRIWPQGWRVGQTIRGVVTQHKDKFSRRLRHQALYAFALPLP